ncbi:MAG: spore coat associated protein CotJA [Oscillospiraceae bacterium]|jgi:hypothetical protein|nr:spore coat associated protein CotJA [Oscillospiraceae bacterium]MDD3260528.1 spore coat associated protein CotJA [Oscillospiraceae bacterium]
MEEIMSGQSCATQPLPPIPKDTALAMAYVPFQKFENLYQPEEGLDSGTLFRDLHKPFLGGAKK